ncbi:MAG: CHAD domain-containing protein [Pararhizobium sp.]
MSYRLRLDRKLVAEIRRIAHEELDAASAALKDETVDRSAAIHDMRKSFKKLRGLTRLLRTAAPDFHEEQNARLRDAARALSGLRDATALVETVDALGRHIGEEHAPTALSAVRQNLLDRRERLAAGRRSLDAEIAEAVEACRQARAAFDGLHLDGSPRRIVAAGWRRICRQARDAIAACEAAGEPADFHDLRKRVKFHWMHVRLLEDLWPSSMKLRRTEAKRLEAMLGDEHNLSVLAALMENEPDAVGSGAEREIVARLLADWRAELRAQALAGAKTMFREKPKASGRRISLLWRRFAG